MGRISCVANIYIGTVSDASTFLGGDAIALRAQTNALAIQREVSVFFEDEGNFADWPAFTRPIPQPGIEEDLNLTIYDECPLIKVGAIKLTAVSTASAFQVGSNARMDLESRRKHIRHFVTGVPEEAKKRKETIVI